MTQGNTVERVLADTNAFLYFINNDSSLTEKARDVLESDVSVCLSSASIWEVAIKVSIGKLTLPDAIGTFIPTQLQENNIDIIVPSIDDYEQVSRLPFHHKDPFDRLIIAQAIVAGLPVVSSDADFDHYGITRIW
ncbi:MAG: type II toxin-antitoxin system VapC family toxin [Pyrinomonadaceae bacterium]|nr:type II toxin-antitoxin system VapC family toxin [Pyrinomonadaceae bacterium]